MRCSVFDVMVCYRSPNTIMSRLGYCRGKVLARD